MTVLRFPEPLRSAQSNASRIRLWSAQIRLAIGRVMQHVGIPGAVRDVRIEDAPTGNCLEIATGPLFTRVSINGRDFFFERLIGRFDGTGSASPPSDYRPVATPQSTASPAPRGSSGGR